MHRHPASTAPQRRHPRAAHSRSLQPKSLSVDSSSTALAPERTQLSTYSRIGYLACIRTRKAEGVQAQLALGLRLAEPAARKQFALPSQDFEGLGSAILDVGVVDVAGTAEEVAHLDMECDACGDVSRAARAPGHIRLLRSCHRHPNQGTQQAKGTVVHCLSFRTKTQNCFLSTSDRHSPAKKQNTGPDQIRTPMDKGVAMLRSENHSCRVYMSRDSRRSC